MSHGQSLLFPSCWTSSAHSTRTWNPAPSLFLSHGDDHCDDPQHVATFGPLAEPQLPTWYEPNDLTEMNNTDVTPMFFHRPGMTLTYDSAESIASQPSESDLVSEQLRDMLASPLYLQEKEASADRSRVYRSYRKNSVSSSSHFLANAGRPAAVFSHRRKSSQESLSDREVVSLVHPAVPGENEALSRLSESENDTKFVIEE